jgi:hypothetical protein
MTARPIFPRARLTACLIVAAIVVCPDRSLAQGHGGESKHNAATDSGFADVSGPKTPELYGGQIYCPVTGKKLGLTPIAVETSIGIKQPGFWGKLFGQKPTPGVVIYVCCPECVEAVKRDPMTYLGEIVADKSCFNFTYAKAPAQRPQRVRNESAPVASSSADPDILPKPPPLPPPSPLARPATSAAVDNAAHP